MHRSYRLFLLSLLASTAAATAQTGQNINHALTGSATQWADHPTYPTAVASRLIDGNRNGIWLENSCNVTAPGAAPWWQVALAGPSLVHEIGVYPRSDVAHANNRDFLVELKSGSTVVWSQMFWTGGGQPPAGVGLRLLMPPGGITCDTVRLSRPNVTNAGITLAEVEVLQIAPITPVNWAVYGTATQSPGGTNYGAQLAIDGNTDCNLNNNSSAMTSINGASYQDWWEVALPRRRYDEVRVWPSTWSTFGSFYMLAYDGPTAVSSQLATNAPTTGPRVFFLSSGTVNPYVDRVRIARNSLMASPLILAEVEVINYSALDAEVKPFGFGCLGTANVPRLRQLTPPVVSNHFDVELRNVPANPGLAVIAYGLSRTLTGALPLPLDLGVIGAVGCQAYVSAELTQATIAVGGVALATLAIPNSSALLASELHQQAFVLDPVANTLGLTVSNALSVRLGL